MHVPGHEDKNIYGGGMPAVPGQPVFIPPVSGAAIWSATQPGNRSSARFLTPVRNPYQNNPYVRAYLTSLENRGRESYRRAAEVPAYSSFEQDGMKYQFNPRTGIYEVVGNVGTAGTTAGAGGAGKADPYGKINREAAQKRLAARTQYMTNLGQVQERARLARVGGAEADAALRSNLAQRAIGGFGGISEGAREYVSSVFRTQEGQEVARKTAAYADYLISRLGIARDQANAIAVQAVKQADAGAAKVMAEMERRLDQISKSVAEQVKISEGAGERELAELEKRLGGK